MVIYGLSRMFMHIKYHPLNIATVKNVNSSWPCLDINVHNSRNIKRNVDIIIFNKIVLILRILYPQLSGIIHYEQIMHGYYRLIEIGEMVPCVW